MHSPIELPAMASARRSRRALPEVRLRAALLALACRGAHAIAAQAQVASAVASAAVPAWRVDAVFRPNRAAGELESHQRGELEDVVGAPGAAATAGVAAAAAAAAVAPASAAAPVDAASSQSAPGEAPAPVAAPMPRSPGSTVAEDQQRCPMIKLTSSLFLSPQYVTFGGQTGGWRATPSGITIGSWSQTFLSQRWNDVYFNDLDGRFAVKAEETTDLELMKRHGWRIAGVPPSYANFTNFVKSWEAAQYMTTFHTEVDPENPSSVRIVQPTPLAESHANKTTIALTDCEGELLFVVKMQPTNAHFIGGFDIFDRSGLLVARSLAETRVARHLLVDGRGYLLATAEAPKINASILFENLPKDPAKGGILAYEVRFEQGGYKDASRLLDANFRWVLVAALQMRALSDGRAVWAPSLPDALPVVYWLAVVVLTALVAVMCAFVIRPWEGLGASGKLDERSRLAPSRVMRTA